MLSKLPVLTLRSGMPQIEVFQETDSGMFRRTSGRPFRLLADEILGVGDNMGYVMSAQSASHRERWRTPTIYFHALPPQSLFHFMRRLPDRRRLYIFANEQESGCVNRLNLHELILKPGSGQRSRVLFRSKAAEVMELWESPGVARATVA